MKKHYLSFSILSMYLIFGLCVHATSELNEKDLQEFKVAIQNPPKSLLSLAEAESKQTALERMAKEAKIERREQLAPQLIRKIGTIVQTPKHAERFAFWVNYLDKKQHVLALEAFSEQYNHSVLHQQILNAIFKEAHDDDGEDFFEWNYRNKHLQNFWKLLLKKLPAKHPLNSELNELISGRGWACTLYGYPGPRGLPDILSCDDWAEELKKYPAPYELQVAPIQKSLNLCEVILQWYGGSMTPENFEALVYLYKQCLVQLNGVHALREGKNKKDWKKLVLLFQELRNWIKNPPLIEKEIQSMNDYLAAHPKDKKMFDDLLEQLDKSIDTPNDLLKGIDLLPESEKCSRVKIDRHIKSKYNRQGQAIN